MMTLNDEAAVKKALGISTFREMSKEKMLAFAATMPDMAKEVRLKLVEQIPAFTNFALEAVNATERMLSEELDLNDKSRVQLHEALADVRATLKSELARDDLPEEHRRYLTDKLLSTTDTEAAKDTEHKAFVAKEAGESRKTVVALAGIGVIAAVILAGGKVMVGRGDAAADAS